MKLSGSVDTVDECRRGEVDLVKTLKTDTENTAQKTTRQKNERTGMVIIERAVQHHLAEKRSRFV